MPAAAWIRDRAESLIETHLPGLGWSFGFDNAKRRAGLTDYPKRRIQVSRYLADEVSAEEVDQVLLHEIAHALAGHAAAHGPEWRRIAAAIGCRGERVHRHALGEATAPWVGECPAGHRHVRFRRPTRQLSCGRCSTRFSRDALIRWEYRGRAADQVPSSSTRTSFQKAT